MLLLYHFLYSYPRIKYLYKERNSLWGQLKIHGLGLATQQKTKMTSRLDYCSCCCFGGRGGGSGGCYNLLNHILTIQIFFASAQDLIITIRTYNDSLTTSFLLSTNHFS